MRNIIARIWSGVIMNYVWSHWRGSLPWQWYPLMWCFVCVKESFQPSLKKKKPCHWTQKDPVWVQSRVSWVCDLLYSLIYRKQLSPGCATSSPKCKLFLDLVAPFMWENASGKIVSLSLVLRSWEWLHRQGNPLVLCPTQGMSSSVRTPQVEPCIFISDIWTTCARRNSKREIL